MTTDVETRYATMIRDLPQGERPRERLREYGPSVKGGVKVYQRGGAIVYHWTLACMYQ